jgi:Protein of unknown function (DUF2914)
MKLCLTSLLALLPLFPLCASLAACDGSRSPKDTESARPLTVAPTATAASTAVSSYDASRGGAPSVAAPNVTAAVAVAGGVQGSVATTTLSAPGTTRAASSLIVKRLVVTTGVKDREPVRLDAPLLADGSAIYAFVELANPVGPSEKVRITFERKGAPELVGNVTLPVPSSTPRHRTWAFTRFIRTPGQWDAVLWSESGVELGRTSFEVGSS